MIKLRGVSKIYKMGSEEVHALRRVDLDINDGDPIARFHEEGFRAEAPPPSWPAAFF